MTRPTTLKRVAHLRAGGTPAVDDPTLWDDDGGVEWVAIGDMTRSRIVRSGTRRVSERGIAEKRLPIGPPGTVLFAMYASLGAVAVLGIAATWNQAILGVQARDGVSDSRFIAFWLEHLARDLSALARSNTQDNLNAEQVANLPFPTLAVEDQRRIAGFLDAETARIDALIEKKLRMVGLLDERLRAMVMDELFGARAPWVRVGRAVDLLPGFAFSSHLFSTEAAGGVRLLRGINVAPGRTRWDETVYLDVSLAQDAQRFALAGGDLVIGMDRPVIGRGMRVAEITDADVPCLLVQRVARLRVNELAERDWIRLALMSPAFVAYFSPIVTGVSVPHISPDQIASFKLPLPEREKQRLILWRLLSVERVKNELSHATAAQIALLREHRQALITAAVTGQLDIAKVVA